MTDVVLAIIVLGAIVLAAVVDVAAVVGWLRSREGGDEKHASTSEGAQTARA